MPGRRGERAEHGDSQKRNRRQTGGDEGLGAAWLELFAEGGADEEDPSLEEGLPAIDQVPGIDQVDDEPLPDEFLGEPPDTGDNVDELFRELEELCDADLADLADDDLADADLADDDGGPPEKRGFSLDDLLSDELLSDDGLSDDGLPDDWFSDGVLPDEPP